MLFRSSPSTQSSRTARRRCGPAAGRARRGAGERAVMTPPWTARTADGAAPGAAVDDGGPAGPCAGAGAIRSGVDLDLRPAPGSGVDSRLDPRLRVDLQGGGSTDRPGVGFTSAVSCDRPCAVPGTSTPRIAVDRPGGPAPTLGPVFARPPHARVRPRVLVGPGSPPSRCQGPPDRVGRQPSRNRPADRPRAPRGVPRLPQKGTSCPS